MRWYFLLILSYLLLFLNIPHVTAQTTQFVESTPHCTALAWNPNPEEDVAGYCVWSKRHEATEWIKGQCVTGKDTLLITCHEAGVTHLGPWNFALSAYDTSGNQSELSAPVFALHRPRLMVKRGVEEQDPPPTDPPVTSELLQVTGLFPSRYVTDFEGLAVGKKVYIDRAYEYQVIPPELEEATYIRTANGDKRSLAIDPHMMFDVNIPVTVYIGIDVRVNPLPAWLFPFVKRPDLVWDTGDKVMEVYSRAFTEGHIALNGTNTGQQLLSMYIVALVPL